MKFFLVFLAVVAVTSGYEFAEKLDAKDRSISSQVVDAIEGFRDQMPCGFPGLGIPILAPLKIEHKELNIENESLTLKGTLDKLRVDGLNNFDIIQFKVNAILSRVNFELRWNHAYLTALYDLLVKTEQIGTSINANRQGLAKFGIKGLTIKGQIKYSLGVLSGNIKLKEFKVYVTLDEVNSEIEGISTNKHLNKFFNKLIEEWIMLAINDNTDNVAELGNDMVVPMVNNMIGDMGLTDIIGMIGGGGGNGEDPVIKEPCVPPTED